MGFRCEIFETVHGDNLYQALRFHVGFSDHDPFSKVEESLKKYNKNRYFFLFGMLVDWALVLLIVWLWNKLRPGGPFPFSPAYPLPHHHPPNQTKITLWAYPGLQSLTVCLLVHVLCPHALGLEGYVRIEMMCWCNIRWLESWLTKLPWRWSMELHVRILPASVMRTLWVYT